MAESKAEAVAEALAKGEDPSICTRCARASGAVWPKQSASQLAGDRCGYCGAQTLCCATSEYNWPRLKLRRTPK